MTLKNFRLVPIYSSLPPSRPIYCVSSSLWIFSSSRVKRVLATLKFLLFRVQGPLGSQGPFGPTDQ